MTTETQGKGIEQELSAAIGELRAALQRANDAAGEVQRIMPRVGQLSLLFDEIANVVNSGRQQLGATGVPGGYARPTLVVPSTPVDEPVAPKPSPETDPWTQLAGSFSGAVAEAPEGQTAAPVNPSSATLVSFRLEFESKPGPLDLRAVDDAVSEHPSVRDVALLDYDGRKATLKVWIEDTATPAQVHEALAQKATSLFGTENEVTVTAHDDAA